MTLLQAIFPGILQGATEFIPVSSSGPMVLAPWLLGWPEPGLTFDTISTPTDVPSGMVVAACTVVEVLSGRGRCAGRSTAGYQRHGE